MPDLETRLPELLRDLSTQMPAEIRPGSAVRRARRRRLRNGGGAVALAGLIAIASFTGVEALRQPEPHRAGSGQSSVASPSPAFRGIWPETTESELAAAQAQVDEGHTPLRTDAVQTAAMLATSLFGWRPDEVSPAHTNVLGDYALVELTNRVFGDDVPPITVQLERLGSTGAAGVWTVVTVETTLVKGPTVTESEGTMTVSGELSTVFDGSTVHVDILSGATDATAVSGTVVQLSSLDHGRFTATVPSGTTDASSAVVWIRVDEAGKALGATAIPARGLVDGRFPATDPFVVPPDVAATEHRLVVAVAGLDIPALQTFMDPNTFSYNADDGSNPIPLWKEDPSVLDPILSILRLAPTAPKTIEGYGTFYVWPYLADSDFDHLTPSEIEDLHMLGFDDSVIEQMRTSGGYRGPRLSIDANGVWRSYSTGGLNQPA